MRVAMIVVLAAMLLSLTAGVFAQEEEFQGIHKGMQEVTAYGSYTFGEGGNDDTWVVALGYGYLMTDNIELTGFVIGSDTLLFLLPSVTYYFVSPGSTTVPYVALDLGYAFVDGGDDAFAWGGRAGAKFFSSENRAYFAEFQYLDYGDDSRKSINFGMSNLY